MKRIEHIMGMPIIVVLPGKADDDRLFEIVFDYFRAVDEQFSPFKDTSEVARMNRNPSQALSPDMATIVHLAKRTAEQTNGYFSAWHDGRFDPSGIVKGWAIEQAAGLLRSRGQRDYYVEAGGDIAVSGKSETGLAWRIGIRNPRNHGEIVKVLSAENIGVATSGTAARGQHIYNPHMPEQEIVDVLSITVVAPTVLDADRFATAAFAMGRGGIDFIEQQTGLDGYMIDTDGMATMTSGFERFVSR